jgi:CRISPR-associated protein Cas1
MRIIEISTPGAAVRVQAEILVIERPGNPVARLPAEDIELIVVEVPHVALSGAALALCAAKGISVMLCDARHLPTGWIVPVGHRQPISPDRARRQAGLPQRTADRLWRDIVICKIERQADVLADLGRAYPAVRRFAKGVLPGDPANREGSAAAAYWREFFAGAGQRRDGGPVAVALDWGYAVLRAILGRAIVASGLHPGIGLKHRGETDPFPLAADLMEPFRPIVDRMVFGLTARLAEPGWKAELAQVGDQPVEIDGAIWTVRSAVFALVQSFAVAVEQGKGQLSLPARFPRGDDARCVPQNVAVADV